MTPDIFKQSKNLFLVFPPGCGGNHVANMLSMTPDFEPRYTYDNYYEDIVYKYQHFFGSGPESDVDCTAHFCDLQNLQLKQLIKFESKIVNSKKPYILCSHAVEYIIRNNEKEIELLTDRMFCLFSNPTGSNKLVNDRMHNGGWYNAETDDKMYLTYKVKTLYSKEIFAEVAIIDPNKIFTLDTDIFYTVDGYDYIDETVKTHLGIELPKVCRKMHTQYINYAHEFYGEG